MNSNLDFKFEVVKAVDNSRYANDIDVRLVNLGPIDLFSVYRMTKSCGKKLKDNIQARIVFNV